MPWRRVRRSVTKIQGSWRQKSTTLAVLCCVDCDWGCLTLVYSVGCVILIFSNDNLLYRIKYYLVCLVVGWSIWWSWIESRHCHYYHHYYIPSLKYYVHLTCLTLIHLIYIFINAYVCTINCPRVLVLLKNLLPVWLYSDPPRPPTIELDHKTKLTLFAERVQCISSSLYWLIDICPYWSRSYDGLVSEQNGWRRRRGGRRTWKNLQRCLWFAEE